MPVPAQPLTPVEQLAKIMDMEASVAEEIIKVLTDEQNSLINFSGDELELSVERCSEMIRRMNALERDRMRILSNAMKGTPAEKYASSPEAFDRLMSVLDNRGGIKSKLKTSRERLRNAVAGVVQRNSVNSILLEHSMNYAQQSIKLITSDFSRQIVDQKL